MKPIKRNEYYCCYDKKCRHKADPIEKISEVFFEPTQEYEDSPPKDSLAVQKGSALLTRKFALVPDTTTLHQRKQVYSNMTDIFVKIISLKNLYIKKLIKQSFGLNYSNSPP